MFLAHLELVVTNFGSPKVPKSLRIGCFGTKQGQKNRKYNFFSRKAQFLPPFPNMAQVEGFFGHLKGRNGSHWAQNGLKTLGPPKWSRDNCRKSHFGGTRDLRWTPFGSALCAALAGPAVV